MMKMRHLMWKDAITIKPLVIAAGLGIIGLHVMLICVISLLGASRADVAGGFVSLWILMPNLVALGAPAMLVGTEEESGTLSWLRTLPVRWQGIVDSKLLVALGAVVVIWTVASIVLAIGLSLLGPTGGFAHDINKLQTVLHLMWFSLMLLLTGFAASYLFRSPVTALICVLPMMGVINALWIEAFVKPITRLRLTSSGLETSLLIAGGVVVMAVLWAVQRYLGKRRLTRHQQSRWAQWRSPQTVTAYRPPARVGAGRPSRSWAMLWQQWKQTGAAALAIMVIVGAFLLVGTLIDQPTFQRGGTLGVIAALAPPVAALGGCWLGSLAFYGDNVRRRCAFYADRGVSPGRVWWTRIALPLACVIVLVLVSSVGLVSGVWFGRDQAGGTMVSEVPFLLPSLLLIGFGFGQLVSQWLQRPTLAFFGAPAYGLFFSMVLFALYAYYPGYVWTSLLMVPALLLATLRLSGRWLEGKIDAGSHLRVVAYTLLALAFPFAGVFLHRYLTTPASMPQWRSEMLAWNGGFRSSNIKPRASWEYFTYPSMYTNYTDLELDYGSSFDQDATSLDRYIERLRAQVDSSDSVEIMALYCRYQDLPSAVAANASDEQKLQLQSASIALALKWARMIREDIAAGRALFYPSTIAADKLEYLAAWGLAGLKLNYGRKPELVKLAALIPTPELRRESRRNGLILAWQHYQWNPWEYESNGIRHHGKAFLGNAIARGVDRLSLERTRADRYIDLATRRALEQLSSLRPNTSSDESIRTDAYWQQALGPSWKYRLSSESFLPWDDVADDYIEGVRSSYASPSEQQQP